LDTLQDPTRIFSGDESNIISNLACQGDRNVYDVDTGPAKASLTAMFTVPD